VGQDRRLTLRGGARGKEREFLTLLRAVAKRDTASIAATGFALFHDNYAFISTDDVTVALLATAAAAIREGHPAEAGDLMRKVLPAVNPNRQSQLAFSWLTAIAAQRAPGASGIPAVAKIP
jgi:hypothetical protein